MYRRLEYYVNAQKRQVDIFFVSDFYFLETIGRSRGRGIGRSSETLKIVQTVILLRKSQDLGVSPVDILISLENTKLMKEHMFGN